MAAGETQLYAKVSNKLKSRSTSSLLEPLVAMGFPAHTALKALAATGRKTAEDALDWLHCHCNDPSLDDPIPQEYGLFLCPTGPLLEKLQEFWRESKRQCAKNRAHEIFPHMTLCDFFTCEDHKVECLYEALKRAGDQILGSFPSVVPLVLHSSVSYLGFFVNDSPADIIREFAMMFAKEASILADCTVKPCTKQLHMTLAHKFYPHHQRTLEQLAKGIPLSPGCQWTAALYSRDMRFVHYQTLRAIFQYKPQNMDELMLSPGDYIFVDPTHQEEASEGWVIGISRWTGCRGFLPENYTERANESDTWVKHRTYTFSVAMNPNSRKDGEASSGRNGELHPPQTCRSVSSVQALQATVMRRSVLVVRHGERVDQIFGKSWLQQCSTADECSLEARMVRHLAYFGHVIMKDQLLEKNVIVGKVEESMEIQKTLNEMDWHNSHNNELKLSYNYEDDTGPGKYYRPDLNFPCSLPRRRNGIKDFENDPPLSSCGIFQSRLVGEALLDSGIRITSAFVSPALRCVQTAKHILEELKLEKKIKIRVEPGIFEWTKWEVSKTSPTLMTLEELKEANFNVDTNYRPTFPLSSLLPAESYEEYVHRCSVSVEQIVSTCSKDVGVTLIVSHGSALDSCTRPLLGLPPRESGDFAQLVRKFPPELNRKVFPVQSVSKMVSQFPVAIESTPTHGNPMCVRVELCSIGFSVADFLEIDCQIPSLGMCFCEENKKEGKWELVDPPVKTLTHGSNSAFNWRNWILGS